MCIISLYCRWQRKFRSVSLRLGYIGNTCWAFLFFPVTRGSSILPLVGLTSESSIKYHIWLGHLSMVLFGFHTLGFIVYWAMTNQMAEVTWIFNYLETLLSDLLSNCTVRLFRLYKTKFDGFIFLWLWFFDMERYFLNACTNYFDHIVFTCLFIFFFLLSSFLMESFFSSCLASHGII